MGISFGSINTGLPKDIVKQIIAAEKIPIQEMEKRKGNIDEQKKLLNELLSLFEKMKTNLLENDSAINFKEYKVNTNNDVVDVTVDKKSAHVGKHQLEVTQLAGKSSAMTSGFASPEDSYLGVGYVQYYLPNGETKDLYVDSHNSTLKDVARLINEDPANNMTATVVNDGSGSNTPWRLIVSLNETGDDNLAEFPYLYFVDGEQDFYIEFEREAQDAKVKLDGFEIELPKNKTSDLIPGLTLDLKKAKPGEEFTIDVKEDDEKITDKINNFTTTINDILKFIYDQNNMDEHTNTRKTLGGDITLQTIESRLRRLIFSDVKTSAGNKRLSDFGITFKRDGLLEMNQDKFKNAIKKDYQSAEDFFTGSFDGEGVFNDGLIQKLKKFVGEVLRQPSGLLISRKKGMESKMSNIDKRIENRQRIIDQKEKMLKDKFARLEETINKIKSQGSGLAALGAAASASPVQQLG